jgi:hypothetical protein
MCIYCGTNKYRKIYEHHHGSIPKEENGRTYEIHHIDGNHSNNNPSNLTAVTLQDHYDIHYSQQDWGACYLMSVQRMNKTPEEISELSSRASKERISNGTSHFCGEDHPSKIRSRDGTHFFYHNKFLFSGKDNHRYDHTLYSFQYTSTKNIVTMTQREFIVTYNLKSSNVNHMISGRRKSVRGWKLYIG